MDEEIIGFVSGNNYRQKLLTLLGSKGGMDAARIAKTMHVIRPSVDKILGELMEKGLLSKEGDTYELTELGTTVERQVQGL